MPRSINGFGTSYHGNGASIHWEKPAPFALGDHDAIECSIALGFPVFPGDACHTFLWSHRECRVIRIRRSAPLILHALLRPYVLVATWLAMGFLILMAVAIPVLHFSGVGTGKMNADAWKVFAIPAAVALGGMGLLSLLNTPFRRARDIRLVTGPHEAGSSDPATWLEPPSEDFARPFDGDSARRALQEGQFSKAMYAARILAARGDDRGEALTDEILADPRVLDRLPALRRRPWLRQELFPEDRGLRIPLENRGSYATWGGISSTNAGYHG
ncbi:MAG TPA: hypothetical protein VF950_14130 [Planctomycetota bacterium]